MKKILSLTAACVLCLLLFAAALPIGAVNDSDYVSLTAGQHASWIDRIDIDAVDYARKFYNFLLTGSDVAKAAADPDYRGALIDPTVATRLDDGSYVYTVTSFSGEGRFTPSFSAETNEARALEAINPEIDANQQKVAAYINTVYNAFDRDHPEVFWLSRHTITVSGFSYQYDATGKVSYKQTVYFLLKSNDFDIRAEGYRSEALVRNKIKELLINPDGESILSRIIADAPTDSRASAVRYFNDILTKRNCYNSNPNLDLVPHDSLECTSALVGSVGLSGPVCEGYSRAFKVLCDAAGIPCILVNGNAGGEGHMWNYVMLEDGTWYAVDVTWNDPVVSGSTSAVSGVESESFLLVGSDTVIEGKTFSEEHIVTNRASAEGIGFTNEPPISKTAFLLPEIILPDTIKIMGITVVENAVETGNALPDGVDYNAVTGIITIADGTALTARSMNSAIIESTGDITVSFKGAASLRAYFAPAIKSGGKVTVIGGTSVINSGTYAIFADGGIELQGVTHVVLKGGIGIKDGTLTLMAGAVWRISESDLLANEAISSAVGYFECADLSHLTVKSLGGTHKTVCVGECHAAYESLAEACSGGTATCQSPARCTLCGGEHGELGEHSFTAKEETEAHLKLLGENCGAHNEYWYGCTLCDAVSDSLSYIGKSVGPHILTEAIESDEYYVEGSGDCRTNKSYYYACNLCGGVGELTFVGSSLGEHKLGEYMSDGGSHYRKCTVSDCDYITERAAHSGGEASCKSAAVCEICGLEYGERKAHTYDNACDAICNICREQREKPPHADTDNDNRCDECGLLLVGSVIRGYIEQYKTYIIAAAGAILLLIIVAAIVKRRR